MFPGKTKSIPLIIIFIFAGVLLSPLGGQVVNSWAGGLIKSIHISGATEHDLQTTHISGSVTPAVDPTDLGAAWDEVTALPVHVSGAEGTADVSVIQETPVDETAGQPVRTSYTPAQQPERIVGEEGVVASIPSSTKDIHLSGSISTAAHVSGTLTTLAGRALNLQETDSSGSYNHGAAKSEGSKSTVSPHHSQMQAPASTESHPYMHGGSGEAHGQAHEGFHAAQGGHHGEVESYGHSQASDAHHGGHHGGHHAMSGHHGGHHGHDMGGNSGHDEDFFKHILKFKHVLNLTDEQIEAILDRQFEFNKVALLAEAEHTIAHIELDKWAHSANVNETRLRGLADEISAIKSKKIHAMAEGKIAILNILTEAQRLQVHKMHLHHP